MAGLLTLDSILTATNFFAGRWTPTLKRNQSRDVLRLLLYKLFAQAGGSLFHRHARSSHAALADSLNLSREWTCKLIGRLREAGWIETLAPRLPDGTQEITIFRPGRMLKRLLVMLLKSKQRRPHTSRVNDPSQKIPSDQDRAKGKALFAGLMEVLSKKLGPPSTRR